MSEPDQYMLMFTLGPVQPFIQQARKARDFWTGSLLLSKLMEAAMEGIEGKGKRFIFPATRVVREIPEIPNKYIAVFDDLAQAQTAAEQSQRQVALYWQNTCNTVWAKIIAGHDDEETRQIWRRQTGVDPATGQVDLDAFFEVYWAIVKREENQKYGNWFEAAEHQLAARKRLRDFRAKEEPGEKSAVSGEREILRRRSSVPRELQQFWIDVATKCSPVDIDQEGKERLDAIDTVKRFAMQAGAILIEGQAFQKPFPSTSFVATASFVERLLQVAPDLPPHLLYDWGQITNDKLSSRAPEAARALPYLARRADQAGYGWMLRRDGDLYFAETFVPRRLEKDYGVKDIVQANGLVKQGGDALRALLRATDALKVTRPTPYYAVIQMDGDNMGILLSGVENETEHRDISTALSSFSTETAPNIVEQQYPAKLVYAGGDDVLAFAPLARDQVEDNQPQHILQLVDLLQSEYRKKVRAALPASGERARSDNVTASTGIVLAHHYTSLSYILRSAREAERAAKQRYGRNALVVTLIRRSGEQTQVGCHWRYRQLEEAGQPIALFAYFYQLFQADVLSPKSIHVLLDEVPALIGLERSAQRSEVKRVLKRQLRDHLDAGQQRLLLGQMDQPERELSLSSAEKKQQIAEKMAILAERIVMLAEAMDKASAIPRTAEASPLSVELQSVTLRYGLVEVLGWLLVMAFLARKGQE